MSCGFLTIWYCNCKTHRERIFQANLEVVMRIQLNCPSCSCCFGAAPDAPASEILDRMTEEGPWCAVGDGETFEDMIFARLTAHGSVRCTECGEPVDITEESLGRLTLEVLAQW
jgi:hypothetical protein